MFTTWLWIFLGLCAFTWVLRLVLRRTQVQSWIDNTKFPFYKLRIGLYVAWLLTVILRDQVGGDTFRSVLWACSVILLALATIIGGFEPARPRQRHPLGRLPQRTWWDEPSAATAGEPRVAFGTVSFGFAAICAVALAGAVVIVAG